MKSELIEKEVERIRAKRWSQVTQEEKNYLLRLVWLGREIERHTLYSDDPIQLLRKMALRPEDLELLERLDPQGTSYIQH